MQGQKAARQPARRSARIRDFNQSTSRHTQATVGNAVEQANAPVTPAVQSYFKIQGISVATHRHWSGFLYFYTEVENG